VFQSVLIDEEPAIVLGERHGRLAFLRKKDRDAIVTLEATDGNITIYNEVHKEKDFAKCKIRILDNKPLSFEEFVHGLSHDVTEELEKNFRKGLISSVELAKKTITLDHLVPLLSEPSFYDALYKRLDTLPAVFLLMFAQMLAKTIKNSPNEQSRNFQLIMLYRKIIEANIDLCAHLDPSSPTYSKEALQTQLMKLPPQFLEVFFQSVELTLSWHLSCLLQPMLFKIGEASPVNKLFQEKQLAAAKVALNNMNFTRVTSSQILLRLVVAEVEMASGHYYDAQESLLTASVQIKNNPKLKGISEYITLLKGKAFDNAQKLYGTLLKGDSAQQVHELFHTMFIDDKTELPLMSPPVERITAWLHTYWSALQQEKQSYQAGFSNQYTQLSFLLAAAVKPFELNSSLMPSLPAKDAYHTNINQLKLTEFIIDDKGQQFLSIFHILHETFKYALLAESDTLVYCCVDKDEIYRELSDAEYKRLLHHYPQANEFNQKLQELRAEYDHFTDTQKYSSQLHAINTL
jgi:hypothetical protein